MSSLPFPECEPWVLVTPAEDLPGAWIAHVLLLDVVTQGDSIEDALAMSLDAVRLVVESDVASGLSPFDRRRAPPERWARRERVLNGPDRKPLAELAPSERPRVVAAAARIAIGIEPEVRVEIVPGAIAVPWGGWT